MSNEDFKGYIDEVRVTKDEASNQHLASWQGWRLRLALLLGAIKNLFTGKGVWLSGSVQMNVGTPGITAACWIKPDGDESKWEYWAVMFDGKKAVGFNNGNDVSATTAKEEVK